MTQSIPYIREHIQQMPNYVSILPLDVLSDELGIPVEKLVKLDANENPYGPLPVVIEEIARMNTFQIYPDPESRQIRKLLADQHQVSEYSIVMGGGSDELIDLIMRIVIDPGDVLLNCPPTFGMYAFDGDLNQAKIINAPRCKDFSLDIPGIMEAVEKYQPKLLFIANPNNPDGGLIPEAEFELLVNLPLLLVMDEAYIQFSEKGSSVLDLVKSRSNLIVLRTFSKWAGLAGLRIGYGVFPELYVSMLMKVKQPYNVSVVAERAAVIIMQNLPKSEEKIGQIVEQREILFEELKKISWLKPYSSQTNFILCKVEGFSARKVQQHLRKLGILIRHFDKPGLSDYIRISIGTQEQIKTLLYALKGIR